MRKRAKRATVALLTLTVVGYVIAHLGGSGGSGLPRATRDRLDDFRGPQIHFVYAVPSGRSVDIHRDTDGTLSESIVLLFAWFHQQIGAPILSIDTFKGRPDVTYVRLPRTDA